jgi:hypothetical protein
MIVVPVEAIAGANILHGWHPAAARARAARLTPATRGEG